MGNEFVADICAKSKQNINLCYQCKKCAAGCPVGDLMEYKNYELLRLIQLGDKDTVLKANTPWVCLSCKACSTRCPNGIDTAKILDVLKAEELCSGMPLPERKIAAFHMAFLTTVQLFGRAFEIGLIGLYKLKTYTFTQYMTLGIKMIVRNKLNFLPHRVKHIREIRSIFNKAKGGRL